MKDSQEKELEDRRTEMGKEKEETQERRKSQGQNKDAKRRKNKGPSMSQGPRGSPGQEDGKEASLGLESLG